jgi:hypothetical protein
MTNHEEIFSNPLYIRWIFNPNTELDLYWDDYLEKHPSEAHHLLELKSKLRNIRLVNESLSEEEKIKLAYQISKKLDKEDARRKFRNQFVNLLKYAAIAVLFFSIGAIVVYKNTKKDNLAEYIGKMELPHTVKSPLLILPEGQSVAINKGESTLNYRNPGEIILNNDSIINTNETSSINQLVIPYGSSSKIVMSDSTVVWLNAGSSLIFPSAFKGKTREVVLFGEAYFDVFPDEDKPFIVQTSALEIRALGTEFNVTDYSEDNIIQTVLKEGSVAIRKLNAAKNEKEIILKPNYLASFDKRTKNMSITEVNTDFYTLWTDGLLSFENRDLNRVIKSLERYYNINIQFENPLTGLVEISGKLDLNQNQEEVFEYLSKVSATKFEKIDEKYFKIK